MSKVLRYLFKNRTFRHYLDICKDKKMETKPRKVMVYENNYDYKTNKWSKSESGIIGYFLAFGIAADEDAHSSFSIAIVEMPDGTVRAVELDLIRFIND